MLKSWNEVTRLAAETTLKTVSVNESTGNTETSVNSQTLNDLISTLQELVQRLAPLAGAMASTAQLRVIGSVAVTSAPSTAVTGPLTSAQSIAEKATGGIDYTNRIAAMNLNAVQSNINNCVGA